MHSGLDNDLRHANLWGISNTMVVIKTKTDPEYLRKEACPSELLSIRCIGADDVFRSSLEDGGPRLAVGFRGKA